MGGIYHAWYGGTAWILRQSNRWHDPVRPPVHHSAARSAARTYSDGYTDQSGRVGTRNYTQIHTAVVRSQASSPDATSRRWQCDSRTVESDPAGSGILPVTVIVRSHPRANGHRNDWVADLLLRLPGPGNSWGRHRIGLTPPRCQPVGQCGGSGSPIHGILHRATQYRRLEK